ncbi:isthmin-2 isoform X1 [Eleutherodactylus coqui]|uniref:isthmin-2 isoform X1 n=1 Tax=Eleutherodactylus coqui TaxID=57060 RepID=UPI00346310D5
MHGLPLLLLLLHFRPQLPTGAPTVSPQLAQVRGAALRGNTDNLVTAQWRGASEQPQVQEAEGLPTPADIVPTQVSKLHLVLRGLSQANLSSENPNIQVTIEVDPSSQTEVELDLSDTRTEWSDPKWRSQHELFWPLFWEYSDFSDAEVSPTSDVRIENGGDSSQYDWDDNVLSGGDNGRSSPSENWITDKYLYDYEDEDWSSWSPCSATCGHPNQKRTRSCGYSCTATESRVCDLPSCPGENDTENSTPLWLTKARSSAPTQASASQDSCDRWLTCKSDFLSNYLQRVLTELPSCPCYYPSEVVYSSLVLRDEKLARNFRWRDASGMRERLDIYNPGARFCLRSLLSRDSSSLGAQHCCYDHSLKLVTRGRAAGIPNLISAEFSPELHYKTDVLPWILCKGDWSRIHPLRPPNNGYGCLENPNEEEYLTQLQEAREF